MGGASTTAEAAPTSTTARGLARGIWHRLATVRLAIVAGGLLRLVWVTSTTTADRAEWYAEWNLRIAAQLADGRTPSWAGEPTAYWPPGVGMLFAPVAWLSDRTGWISLDFGAALVNVGVSTATIGLVAVLARQWSTPRAAVAAAWVMAVSPGHVAVTSVPVVEPTLAFVWVAIVAAATALVDRSARVRAGWWLALGLLVGYGFLVKDISGTLLATPCLVVRARTGSFRGSLRPTLLVLAGCAAVLVPWTVRNSLQVGWTSPVSTIGAEGLCATKYDPDTYFFTYEFSSPEQIDPEWLEDCYPGSIFDTPRSEVPEEMRMPDGWTYSGTDEGAWARRLNGDFTAWAIRNPSHFVEVAPLRLYGLAGNDAHGGVELATQYGHVAPLGRRGTQALQGASTLWYYVVLVAAVVALLRLPQARRAAPLWYPLCVLAVQAVLAPWSHSRHAFPGHPFVVVFAAMAISAVAMHSAGSTSTTESEPARA